jgi:polyisoprenoid-binding protein YceI
MRHVPFVLALALAAPLTASAAARTYVVEGTASQVTVTVGKSGAFSFAGHAHKVRAQAVEGKVVVDPEDPAGAQVELHIPAGSLVVLSEGADGGDAPAVQEVMRGPRVLDVARFGDIDLRSRAVTVEKGSGGRLSARVTGDLSLHGVTREVTVPVTVRFEGDRLTATGEVPLRQTDYGMQPVTAGMGMDKVKDEVNVSVQIVAVASR